MTVCEVPTDAGFGQCRLILGKLANCFEDRCVHDLICPLLATDVALGVSWVGTAGECQRVRGEGLTPHPFLLFGFVWQLADLLLSPELALESRELYMQPIWSQELIKVLQLVIDLFQAYSRQVRPLLFWDFRCFQPSA